MKRYRLILKESDSYVNDINDIISTMPRGEKAYLSPDPRHLGNYVDTDKVLFKFIKKKNNIPAGFIFLYPDFSKDSRDVYITLGVRKEYQHQGISKELLDKAVVWAKKNKFNLRYTVDKGNNKSLNAALKYGFKTTGETKDRIFLKLVLDKELKESGNRMLTLDRYSVLKDVTDITNIESLKNKIYIDTDMHLTEANIESYVKLQKSIVKPSDIFICLGDMIFDEDSDKLKNEWYNYIAQLNGKYKFLVLGNNDILNRKFYTSMCGFDRASLSLKLGNIIFTHCPIHTGSDKLINIHGHIHRKGERRIWVNKVGTRIDYDGPKHASNETYTIITRPVKLIEVLK